MLFMCTESGKNFKYMFVFIYYMLEFNKRKRDKYDIIADILSACKEDGINKTRLMYAAGITYEVAKNTYLS